MVCVWLNVSRRPADLVHVVDDAPTGRGERRQLARAACEQQLTVLFLASKNFDIAGQCGFLGLLILNFAYRFVKMVPTGDSVADHEPHKARTVRMSKQGSAFCFSEHIDAQAAKLFPICSPSTALPGHIGSLSDPI
jgi:hypothetical protein